MTTCFIKNFLFGFIFLGFNILVAQDNFTGYFQPQVAVNYKVSNNYKQNFSIAQRNYIFEDESSTFRTRQIDIVHFSNLKIRGNQSLALGIQYRFRQNFETSKQNELRLTQQYNITFKPRVVRFGHRLRSEQRITKELTIYRFRYRFSLDFPLQGEQLDIGETYFVGNIEALLSVANANVPEYDQRFTANFGWLLREKTRLQIGVEYRFEDYTHQTENILFALTSLVLSL
jgi:hypothetical protein